VSTSRYYLWVIYDVEDWSSRQAVVGSRIQQVLREIEARALRQVGIDAATVGRQPGGDSAILALPGDVPKELITTTFVDTFCEALEEHDASCPPAETIRLRMVLHAGDSPAGTDEWAGSLVGACRLLESDLLHRVLAAAHGAPLALMVSDDWYRAVIGEGFAPAHGYQEVWVAAKKFGDFAWVRVPGRTWPPGLLPADDPDRHRGGAAASSGPAPAQTAGPVPGPGQQFVNIGNVGDLQGATITGNVTVGGKAYRADGRGRSGPR
jgi:hypothetical protein